MSNKNFTPKSSGAADKAAPVKSEYKVGQVVKVKALRAGFYQKMRIFEGEEFDYEIPEKGIMATWLIDLEKAAKLEKEKAEAIAKAEVESAQSKLENANKALESLTAPPADGSKE